jgi:hypothetical protein
MRRGKKAQDRGLRGLGEPTKKDFIAIADLLCNHRASSELVHGFANHFARQNARFDASRFVAATKSCRR